MKFHLNHDPANKTLSNMLPTKTGAALVFYL